MKDSGQKTPRISKEPEVRRQEILDTAMNVFMEKGYEAAAMRDIAAAMHVVPGLCYRYFPSKQALYEAALDAYVGEITAPMISLMEEEADSLEAFLEKLSGQFIRIDGRERYHGFFHKSENHDLQMILSVRVCEALEPYVEAVLGRMAGRGLVHIPDVSLAAPYMLFGAIPIIECDGRPSKDKAEAIRHMMERILQP